MIVTLTRWWRRSRPTRGQLLTAVALAILSATASLILLGGSGLLVVRASGRGTLVSLGGLLIAIEVVAFVRAPLRFKERLSAHRVALRSMVIWRTWLYDTLAPRSPGATSTMASGELLDRAIEDVDALQDLYVRLALPALTCAVTGAITVVVCLVILPLAGAVVAGALIVGIGVAIALARSSDAAESLDAEARGVVSARSADLLLGLGDLVMADATSTFIDLLETAEETRQKRVARRADLRSIGTAVEAALGAGAVLLVALVAGAAHHQGSVTAGEAVALPLMTIAGLEPLAGLLAAALRTPEVAMSAQRLDEIGLVPLPVVEPMHPIPWPDSPSLAISGLVAPSYAGGPPVLRGLNLQLAPGSKTAVLGASGSGKSTLCRVLMRFVAPTGGEVRIGGVDLSSLTGDEVRQHITLLDQSPSLFRGTIRDALKLGDPSATDAELLEVLDRCQLGELARVDHGGLDQLVAEDGATFSGGQQRRLALARALLRRPEVLLLDEPTVGLDPDQARSILHDCLAAAGSATVVLVTHDVEETEGFDQVLWLEDGSLSPLGDAELRSLPRFS